MLLRKQSAALTISALVLALLVAGCSSGGDSGAAANGEAPPIGKATFVKRANAICKAARKRITSEVTAAFKRVSQSGNQGGGQIYEIIATTVPNLQSRVDGIRALGLPAGEEAQASAILDLMQEQVDEAKATPKKFVESRETKQKIDEQVKEFDLTECTLAWL